MMWATHLGPHGFQKMGFMGLPYGPHIGVQYERWFGIPLIYSYEIIVFLTNNFINKLNK